MDEARKWLGVRYANQGRDKITGVDCGGLLLVVGQALGLTELEHLGYANSPDGETFERLLDEQCERTDKLQPGIILACDYGEGIQHTAIVTRTEPRLTVIHAKRNKGVIEQYLHGYDQRAWVRNYAIRGVEYE